MRSERQRRDTRMGRDSYIADARCLALHSKSAKSASTRYWGQTLRTAFLAHRAPVRSISLVLESKDFGVGKMDKAKPGRKACGMEQDVPSAQARLAIAEALCSEVKGWRLSQQKAAARLGIHRTGLNRLLNGDLGRFALGNLYDMAAAAGIDVELRIGSRAADAMPADPEPTLDGGVLFDLAESSDRDRSKLRYAARLVGEREHVD